MFCFDGTWNRLEAPNPTNVVITAESVTPVARDGTVQIIHYDSGVGTGKADHWTGGVFGEGVLDKIVVAYTFLVFNYEPGDEIFVFGFSRGAFSARAFVGFIRSCGIVQRRHAARIADAARLYEARTADQDHNTPELRKRQLTYAAMARGASFRQFQGMSGSRSRWLRPRASCSRTSASQASGSMSLSRAVSRA